MYIFIFKQIKSYFYIIIKKIRRLQIAKTVIQEMLQAMSVFCRPI